MLSKNRCDHLNLQVLRWSSSEFENIKRFLRRWTNLTALSLDCNTSPATLLTAIAAHCPLLQRLAIDSLHGASSVTIQNIAQRCPLLLYLEIDQFMDQQAEERIVDLVTSLPMLCTLVVCAGFSEASLIDIATHGRTPPNLRILKTATNFAYSGLRHITAACPNLTGLEIYDVTFGAEANTHALFEHCGNLKHLVLAMDDSPVDTLNAVLHSVALCCKNLQILDLDFCANYSTDSLDAVLQNCTQLRRVIVKNSALAYEPGAVVSSVYVPLAEWMPK